MSSRPSLTVQSRQGGGGLFAAGHISEGVGHSDGQRRILLFGLTDTAVGSENAAFALRLSHPGLLGLAGASEDLGVEVGSEFFGGRSLAYLLEGPLQPSPEKHVRSIDLELGQLCIELLNPGLSLN